MMQSNSIFKEITADLQKCLFDTKEDDFLFFHRLAGVNRYNNTVVNIYYDTIHDMYLVAFGSRGRNNEQKNLKTAEEVMKYYKDYMGNLKNDFGNTDALV